MADTTDNTNENITFMNDQDIENLIRNINNAQITFSVIYIVLCIIGICGNGVVMAS